MVGLIEAANFLHNTHSMTWDTPTNPHRSYYDVGLSKTNIIDYYQTFSLKHLIVAYIRAFNYTLFLMGRKRRKITDISILPGPVLERLNSVLLGKQYADSLKRSFTMRIVMQWKLYGKERPEEGKLVLVFRNKNKKYVTARLKQFKTEDSELTDDCYGTTLDWVTQGGMCHFAYDEDQWIEFPYVVVQEQRKVYD